jgi:hypothetical protein
MVNLVNKILDDYDNYCRETLAGEFIEYKPTKHGSVHDYQKYKYRIVSTYPREVVEANDLTVPAKYSVAYTEIVKDIIEGKPLKKYQSRNLKRINYNDDMLSHWKIQHFHLGRNIEEDGFVERTKDLLFIFFVKCKAYILGIFSHGDWCDTSIIEILHSNWPTELLLYKSENTGKFLTAEEHRVLRKKNFNTTITMQDGTEYFGPGLGVMLGGSPVEAVQNARKVMMSFERDFEIISLNIDLILNSDPNNKLIADAVTIGLEMNHEQRKFIYKIYETGFRFSLDIQ